MALDAALHEGLLTQELLEPASSTSPARRAAGSAARVVRFADGRSESVGETRSRVVLHDAGSSRRPRCSSRSDRADGGLLVGRTDFAWEEDRVVGEFDGRIKYGRLLRPGQDAGDAVFEEKRREDAIRDEDWDVVRWTWADLRRPRRLGDRVRRARERGARRRA